MSSKMCLPVDPKEMFRLSPEVPSQTPPFNQITICPPAVLQVIGFKAVLPPQLPRTIRPPDRTEMPSAPAVRLALTFMVPEVPEEREIAPPASKGAPSALSLPRFEKLPIASTVMSPAAVTAPVPGCTDPPRILMSPPETRVAVVLEKVPDPWRSIDPAA